MTQLGIKSEKYKIIGIKPQVPCINQTIKYTGPRRMRNKNPRI